MTNIFVDLDIELKTVHKDKSIAVPDRTARKISIVKSFYSTNTFTDSELYERSAEITHRNSRFVSIVVSVFISIFFATYVPIVTIILSQYYYPIHNLLHVADRAKAAYEVAIVLHPYTPDPIKTAHVHGIFVI